MFATIVVAFMLFTFFRSIVIYSIGLLAARKMHDKMVEKLIRARVLFFDSNPVGRMLTRFSKDTSVLDTSIPPIISYASFGVFRSITVMGVVCFLQPWLSGIIVCIVIWMVCVFKYVVPVMIRAQAEDSIFRGPINSGMTNVVTGLVTVRAYERIHFFQDKFIDDLEKSCNVTFTQFVISRLLGWWLDMICLSFVLAVSCFTLLYQND